MLTLTVSQVREVDRLAVQELGIPGLVLMENAGRNVAQVAQDVLENDLHLVPADATVAVLCGGGNNGGDGYVAARHLANAGARVSALAVVEPIKLEGDAQVHWAIADRMGLVQPWDELRDLSPHVVIDALLGTGFHGTEVRQPIAQAILCVNRWREAGAKTVSVDVPSGLNADTGVAAEPTVRADVTVTFVAVKRGLTIEAAGPFVGSLVVADIGAPPDLVRRVIQPG